MAVLPAPAMDWLHFGPGEGGTHSNLKPGSLNYFNVSQTGLLVNKTSFGSGAYISRGTQKQTREVQRGGGNENNTEDGEH